MPCLSTFRHEPCREPLSSTTLVIRPSERTGPFPREDEEGSRIAVCGTAVHVSRPMQYLTLAESSVDTSGLEQYREGVSLPVCSIRRWVAVNADHPQSRVVPAEHFLLFTRASCPMPVNSSPDTGGGRRGPSFRHLTRGVSCCSSHGSIVTPSQAAAQHRPRTHCHLPTAQ